MGQVGLFDSVEGERVMVYAGLIFAGPRGTLACLHLGDGIAELDIGSAAHDVGISEEEALATKELAFNQGFYNLSLAIITFNGIVIGGTGRYGIGLALIFAGTGSMLAAAVVLLAVIT